MAWLKRTGKAKIVEPPRFCEDCFYFVPTGEACSYPLQDDAKPRVIRGAAGRACRFLRESSGECGKDGRWWITQVIMTGAENVREDLSSEVDSFLPKNTPYRSGAKEQPK
jgi:hypothetical protein